MDGACGALAMLAPELAPRLKGIERADSLAFDFHKWGQVPYDAGFVLVRDGVLHRRAFAASAPYLRREDQGLAAGSPWPCDFGPDLSRGFRALKTWFTLKVYGAEALGAAIARTCELARYLENRIARNAGAGTARAGRVEHRLLPLPRRGGASRECADRRRAAGIGVVAPSTTVIAGGLAIRAAIVNHRTGRAEMDALVERTVALGRALHQRAVQSQASESGPGADWAPRIARESALRELETRMAADPDAVSLRFERACLLTELGRTLDARNAYLEMLARAPSHRRRSTIWVRCCMPPAIERRRERPMPRPRRVIPDDAMSHVNLANVLYETGEFQRRASTMKRLCAAAGSSRKRTRGCPTCWPNSVTKRARPGTAAKGFEHRALITLPYRGEGPPVSLLLLISCVGGNIPTRNLLDDRVFQTTVVAPSSTIPNAAARAISLIFNAIGDADLAGAALSAANPCWP